MRRSSREILSDDDPGEGEKTREDSLAVKRFSMCVCVCVCVGVMMIVLGG